ncbi:MAG: hypothetical protein QM845_02320, partial [Verrucomicrobiota bacterium]|nr:hypothetical protein [Verrucomicrobiota bacterium]
DEPERRFAPRNCPANSGTLSDIDRNPVRIKSESVSDFIGMRTLCEQLNALNTAFPGSRLRLHYAIQTPS